MFYTTSVFMRSSICFTKEHKYQSHDLFSVPKFTLPLVFILQNISAWKNASIVKMRKISMYVNNGKPPAEAVLPIDVSKCTGCKTFASCLPCKNFKIKNIKIFQSHKKETHERTIALRNSIFLKVLLPFFYGESLRLQLLYMKLHPLWLTCYNTFSLHFSSMELDWSWTKVLLHLWHHMECQDLGNVRKKKLVKKPSCLKRFFWRVVLVKFNKLELVPGIVSKNLQKWRKRFKATTQNVMRSSFHLLETL